MSLSVQIASAGFRALLGTGVDILAGEAIDAITGVFEGGFGTATAEWLQGNDWRDGVSASHRYPWDWPFPLRLPNTRSELYRAQYAVGQRVEGDVRCYLSPYIFAVPEMPDWPTSQGWNQFVRENPNPSHMAGLRVQFRGPFVVVWRDGVDWAGKMRSHVHGALAGVVDYTGKYKPLTLGKARAVCWGQPYTIPPPGIRGAYDAWANTLAGRSADIPPEILALFLGAAPAGEEVEYYAEVMRGNRLPLLLGAAAIAAALLL